MKLSVFFGLVTVCYVQSASVQVSPHTMNEVKKSYLVCADETKVEPELVLQLRKGNWENNEALKHWVHCVLTKNEMMSNQGVFQMDVAYSKFTYGDKKLFEKIIDECLPTYAGEPKEIAWQFAKCYHRKAPEYSLF